MLKGVQTIHRSTPSTMDILHTFKYPLHKHLECHCNALFETPSIMMYYDTSQTRSITSSYITQTSSHMEPSLS
jgi:hypothetical protein